VAGSSRPIPFQCHLLAPPSTDVGNVYRRFWHRSHYTMLCYKQLWTVEQTFRTAKHLLATQPIFHKLDETIRGHVFCNFLALVLKKALEDRIAALARTGS
jgi:hypothetical protein